MTPTYIISVIFRICLTKVGMNRGYVNNGVCIIRAFQGICSICVRNNSGEQAGQHVEIPGLPFIISWIGCHSWGARRTYDADTHLSMGPPKAKDDQSTIRKGADSNLYLLFASAYFSRTGSSSRANACARFKSLSLSCRYSGGKSRTMIIPRLSGFEPKACSVEWDRLWTVHFGVLTYL